MSDAPPRRTAKTRALDMLVRREEVLEIAYWYQGEGFGDAFDAAALAVFLNCERATVDDALAELRAQGSVEPTAHGFRFTPQGRVEAARLFAEGFADYQKPAHGECVQGCCEDEDHSRCGDDCTEH